MGAYDDIINLPHHISTTRPQMSNINRAAQFAPFAALTGYGAAIKETARLTDKRIELDENSLAILNEKLAILGELLPENPEIIVTYFQPDKSKDGGKYITATGIVKKIDDYEQTIIMMDGTKILLADVLDIASEIFKEPL